MLIALEGTVNSVLEEDRFNNDFSLYPNPSNGTAMIKFKDVQHDNATLRVFDLNGKLVFEDRVNTTDESLNIRLEQSGIFYVQVTFPEYKLTKKLININ